MIGGASVKEWKINSQKKRIPEYLINDLKFISALFEAIGNYSVSDPMICFNKMKSEAWRLTALWKDKHKEAFFFFFFEANFIQLVVLNLNYLNYIKLCLFLTSNKR